MDYTRKYAVRYNNWLEFTLDDGTDININMEEVIAYARYSKEQNELVMSNGKIWVVNAVYEDIDKFFKEKH